MCRMEMLEERLKRKESLKSAQKIVISAAERLIDSRGFSPNHGGTDEKCDCSMCDLARAIFKLREIAAEYTPEKIAEWAASKTGNAFLREI